MIAASRRPSPATRDRQRLAEPMPYAWYAGLRADDLDAPVAYLRTLPPLPR